MANVKRISIRVTPDTSSFNKDLKAALAKIKQEFEVKAHLQVDTAKATASIDKWRKTQEAKPAIKQRINVDGNAFTRALRSADKDAAKVTSTIGRLSKVAGVAALAMAGISSAMNTASLVGPVLVASIGVLGAVPAMAAGAIAAFATVKVGVSGIGDAMKYAFDPSKVKEFNEALKKLSPSAQQFVKALQSLHKPFKDLQQLVQQNLFAGMGEQIKKLGTAYLPVLRTGMGALATDVNNLAKRFITMATSAQSLKDTGIIFDNTHKSMSGLTTVVVQLGAAFRNIAAVGSTFLPQLADSAGKAATRFADFIASARESGKLHNWIQGGLDAFKQLWQVIKDLGSIVATVFKALQQGGINAGGVFGQAVTAVKNFVQSAKGLEFLRTLGATIGAVAQVVRDVLGVALQNLVPALTAILPGIKQFAQQLGAVLVPALRIVGPLITAIFGFIAQNANIIGPAIIAIATAFGVWKVASLAVNAALKANPFILIASIIIGLVGIIIANWSSIASFFSNLWNGIKSVAESVWNAISGFFVGIWNGIVGVARTVWGALTGFFSGLWNGIRSVATSVWNAISGFFRGLWNGIVSFGRSIWNGLASFLSNAWNGIKNTASNIWNSIVNFFRTVWNSVSTAVSNGVKNVINFFANLPGNILRALGNLGNLLLNAGKDLLTGLWNGISNAASWLWGKIKEFFGNLLPGWVKDILGIHSPSKVFAAMGVFLPQGMAVGMKKGLPDLRKAAVAMRDTAVNAASLDEVGTTFSGSLVKTVSADLHATASSPEFASLPDRIATALSGMELRFDGNEVARVVNRANKQNRNR